MPRAEAEVGSTANSYEILAKLATGGMAEIFLARGASAAGVERYVVLKRVLREKATDVHFIKMFLDEARLAAQLQHPNIAQVYDIGKLGDSFFFTMEYVHGETVRALLQRSHALRKPIPIASVLTVAVGAAAGLHHAHERKGIDGKPLGIVHRDVSPSNLMVSYEGNVKVVDFGVAKAAHRVQETRSGTVKGKIAYLSPEQCRGREIDRRSDLFSLGIVIWEMLTTERLFRLGSDFETMQAIVAEPVPPPSSRRADVPPELDHVVGRLLAKTPEERYQTADELHEALENVAVRTSSALSMASLARFVKELFGQRPEPWIELQTHETHSEIVTVTSEPIPPDLGLASVASLDQKLARVPDAERPRTPSRSPVPPMPRMTAPTAAETPNARPATDGLPTTPHQVVTPEAPPAPPAAPAGMFATQYSAVPPMPRPNPVGYTTGPAVPMQYPQQSTTGPSYSQLQTLPKKKSLLPWIVAPAIVIGVVVGIAIAFSGGGDKKADPGEIHMQATPPPAAAVDAEVAQPAVAVDAAVAETPPPPAPVDAGVVAIKPPPEHPKPKDTVVRPKPPEDVKDVYRAGRYDDTVKMCSAGNVAAQNPNLCTIAACHVKDSTKAKKWLALVNGQKHTSVVAECTKVGIQLEAPAAKPPNEDCKHDPMACQH